MDRSEQGLANLRQLAQEFDNRLQIEIQKIEKETRKEVTRDLSTDFSLKEKDVQREQQLAELTINNLDKTIQNQEAEVIDLKKQLIQATAQVKNIAMKVIEGNRKEMPASNGNQSFT